MKPRVDELEDDRCCPFPLEQRPLGGLEDLLSVYSVGMSGPTLADSFQGCQRSGANMRRGPYGASTTKLASLPLSKNAGGTVEDRRQLWEQRKEQTLFSWDTNKITKYLSHA